MEERLEERTVPIDSTIHKNKLQLMKVAKVSKPKSNELKDMKNLAATLSQLYVANHVTQESSYSSINIKI